MEVSSFDFARDGAWLYSGAAADVLTELRELFYDQPQHVAGIRLHGIDGLRPHLAPEGPVGAIAASLIGSRSRPVRAILFDKTAETNWSLGWHQDRTISVRERVDVDGYGPWTIKGGMQHVAPPFDLLSRMVTLRVHMDDVPENNAPLLIVPGSHKLGRIAESEIESVASRLGERPCLAAAGDIWAYATPIIHGSKAAAVPARRRVLQVDYSRDDLPAGLDWLGV
ncbi:phytanoyl-CoA dioxygenase [Sphingopyxis sp. QXT-31]|nr:phytanoyl-CoA dioxygenase [Sphingopyxis sp. QXT-31]